MKRTISIIGGLLLLTATLAAQEQEAQENLPQEEKPHRFTVGIIP